MATLVSQYIIDQIYKVGWGEGLLTPHLLDLVCPPSLLRIWFVFIRLKKESKTT